MRVVYKTTTRYWIKLILCTFMLVLSFMFGIGIDWRPFCWGAGAVVWIALMIANIFAIQDTRDAAKAREIMRQGGSE